MHRSERQGRRTDRHVGHAKRDGWPRRRAGGPGPRRAGQAARGRKLERARRALRARSPSRSASACAGEKITDRLVSISDPDARPIRKGKLGKPTEFGYVAQIAEVTENTRRGARGFILPAATRRGNPVENTCSQTRSPSSTGSASPRARCVCDGGFQIGPTRDSVPDHDERVHLRPPRARLAPHPQAPSALPHRHRGPHQPPQTQLRPAPKHASKATTASRPGPAGASSPTTSTRSPSGPPDTITRVRELTRPDTRQTPRRPRFPKSAAALISTAQQPRLSGASD